MQTQREWITRKPGVCGGDASVRGTRIPVWGLVERRRAGASDARILTELPGLTLADLEAAWEYARLHTEEIEKALWLNRAGGFDYPEGKVPVAVLVRGRQLGIPDDEIRDAFDPPLEQSVLDAAWAEYARHPAEIERGLRDALPDVLAGD